MLAPERRARILDLITRNKSVLVKDLSVLFDVTGETIRKDLASLEQEGRLIKTYGGAYFPDGVRNEIAASIRETVLTDVKDAIGRVCAGMVREGDTIFIDDSTTCLSAARHIAGIADVMVITNSLKVAEVFADSRNNTLLLAGGKLDVKNQSFSGEETRELLGRHYADLCFVSCRGMDKEAGLTDGGEESGVLRRIMLQHAKRRYLVVDQTKLDQINFYRIGGFELVDGVVIDQMGDSGWSRYLRSLGISVTETMANSNNTE